MGIGEPLAAPEPLAETHELAAFTCGNAALDDWLKRRARGNQASGASRTFVVATGRRVVAYCSLASGSVCAVAAPGRFRRNMPDPIPVALMARLAVDEAWHGQGLGRALVRDGALRILRAAETIGIRGIIVHAISEPAKAFYLRVGFEPSPLDSMTLMITLRDVQAIVGASK